ncbi:class I SAM-dependent methyltransferase [Candidatus Uhrbacteria bacterium]|nr:MAG: class I SAM-dependent methyltransferase [Candidatus Uhrbacteria bacterium]
MEQPVGSLTFNPAISKAMGYQRWIFDLMKPVIGLHVLEIGVGSAPFVGLYSGIRRWYPCDIDSKSVARALEIGTSALPGVQIKGYVGDAGSDAFWDQLSESEPDTVIAVNVMEHVKDDALFLRRIYQVFDRSGSGSVGLFVPALPFIYGSMDASAGHYRRYTRSGLMKLCQDAGFVVEHIQYVNFPGIFYWWWRGKIRKTRDLADPGLENSISKIDQYAVPIIRFFEDRVPPPIGQSLVIRLKRVSV